MGEIFSFGVWVRRRRKALDLTQDALARRVGCALSMIRKIEADERTPSRQIATLLASALEVPAAEREQFLHAARAELAVDQLAAPTATAAPEPPLVSACRAAPSPSCSPISRAAPRLWEHEPEQMRLALARHRCDPAHAPSPPTAGMRYKTIGDAFQAAFAFPAHAVAAALAAQRALAARTGRPARPVRVRMGIHVGPAVAEGSDYSTTHTLNRVARIMAAGHGGQILLSGEVADAGAPRVARRCDLA